MYKVDAYFSYLFSRQGPNCNLYDMGRQKMNHVALVDRPPSSSTSFFYLSIDLMIFSDNCFQKPI